MLDYYNGQLVKRYTNGPNIDEHLAMTDITTDENYFYHTDSLGSTTAMTDANGNIVETYDFSVYGEPTIRDNQEIVIDESNIGNRYLHSGREFDSLIGFYYHRARYRDPLLGIWIGKDPAKFVDGPNLYQYVKSNPVNLIDPWGLDGYFINRYIGGKKPVPRSQYVSHTYTATTNGTKVENTYSWGNDGTSWYKNNPVDVQAAQEAIDNGMAEKVTDEEIDESIDESYEETKDEEHLWVPWDNCKHEAENLVDKAKKKSNKLEFDLTI